MSSVRKRVDAVTLKKADWFVIPINFQDLRLVHSVGIIILEKRLKLAHQVCLRQSLCTIFPLVTVQEKLLLGPFERNGL